MSADSLDQITWFADSSFAVHHDGKSHTGSLITLGQGAICCMSRKQKLVTRSSTEAEVVGVYDGMPSAIWANQFLQAQGYAMKPIHMMQDNLAAIQIEKHGSKSCKRTKHMNLRYFWINDRISQGEVVPVYCPTNDMLADILTKPLQGKSFENLRDSLLNI